MLLFLAILVYVLVALFVYVRVICLLLRLLKVGENICYDKLYNMDIMQQSGCFVVNPIMVYNYGFLFNCTTVGQASDSMTALT